jgi:hypothetical protein
MTSAGHDAGQVDGDCTAHPAGAKEILRALYAQDSLLGREVVIRGPCGASTIRLSDADSTATGEPKVNFSRPAPKSRGGSLPVPPAL